MLAKKGIALVGCFLSNFSVFSTEDLIEKVDSELLDSDVKEETFVLPVQFLKETCHQNGEAASLFKDLSLAIELDDGKTFKDIYVKLKKVRDLNQDEIARALIAQDSASCLNILLNLGLNLESTNTRGENLFHEASKMDCPNSCLQVLIEYLKECIESNTEENVYLRKDLKIIQPLLEQDKYGNTPVHAAYDRKKFLEGDLMVDLIQKTLQDTTFNLTEIITNKEGISLKESRSTNKWTQIGGLALSGTLFVIMLGMTLYDAVAPDESDLI